MSEELRVAPAKREQPAEHDKSRVRCAKLRPGERLKGNFVANAWRISRDDMPKVVALAQALRQIRDLFGKVGRRLEEVPVEAICLEKPHVCAAKRVWGERSKRIGIEPMRVEARLLLKQRATFVGTCNLHPYPRERSGVHEEGESEDVLRLFGVAEQVEEGLCAEANAGEPRPAQRGVNRRALQISRVIKRQCSHLKFLYVGTDDNSIVTLVVKSDSSYRGAMVRIRRDPAEARELILVAAERVFAERGPDVAGLKDIAREAGVSHALVTHYFGRFELIVDAVLERVLQRVRDSVAASLVSAVDTNDPSAVMDALFEGFRERSSIRMLAWSFVSGRFSGEGSLPDRVRGLKAIADVIEPHVKASREDIEWVIVTAVTASIGFSMAGESYVRSLGHRPSAARETRFKAFLGDLLRERLLRVPAATG